MTLAQLQLLALAVGFADPALAAAVAMAESGGNPDALGDGGASVGLWQIDTAYHPELDAERLRDPAFNARAAYAISTGGRDFSPWSTFTSGAYRAFYRAPTQPWALTALLVVAGAIGAWWLANQAPSWRARPSVRGFVL